jgi:hypothetical protein
VAIRKSEFVETKLGEHFSRFGTIMNIYVDEKQIYGFIRFQHKDSIQAVASVSFEDRFRIMIKFVIPSYR